MLLFKSKVTITEYFVEKSFHGSFLHMGLFFAHGVTFFANGPFFLHMVSIFFWTLLY